MSRHVLRLSTFVAAVAITAAVTLGASSPQFWRVSTQEDLLKGTVEQLSIDEYGRLLLGPAIRTLHDATAPFVWCLAAGPGGVVFAGTGADGQVLRTDAQGKTTVWFDAPEADVHAIVAAPDGTLYVATSPDGRVYRITATGTSSVYFDPADRYIWSLALNAQGVLFVGTGDKGQIYRVTPGGTGSLLTTTTTAHVMALAFDGQGRLLAGTGSPGRIMRVEADGRIFVLADTPYREVRALQVNVAGAIIAAAVNGKPSSEPAPAAGSSQPDAQKNVPVASVSSEITAVTVIDTGIVAAGSSSIAGRDSSPTPKGAVLRLDRDGAPEPIWQSSDDIPFDISLDGADGVYIATGQGGKIYRVAGNPARTTLVTRVASQQATALLRVGNTRYVATSNPGRIVALESSRAAQGTYLSDVKDAGTTATWGTLSWRTPGGQVQLSTRSGNTATVDDGWSPWSAVYTSQEGSHITSPAARYLQWKAVFTRAAAGGGEPALTSLTIAYLQRNLRPRVTDITIHPPGVVFQKPYPTGEPEIAGLDSVMPEYRFPVFSMPLGTPVTPSSGPALGRRLYQKGLQALAWKAQDDNDDRLVYDLQFREAGETSWHTLRSGVLDELLVWDTTSVPDGSYVVRVAASDRLSNTPEASLAGENESRAFDIDNTPPVITATVTAAAADSVIRVDVEDSHSAVTQVEYSIDGGPWQQAFPADGAADSRHEQYEVKVEGRAAGRVVFRATDTMNNTGTAKVIAPQPSPSVSSPKPR
jgi:sugar lactone lactonase YvrE